MNIKSSLNLLFSKFSLDGLNEDSFDDTIIDYLKETFSHTFDSELAEIQSLCEAYIPNIAYLPSSPFLVMFERFANKKITIGFASNGSIPLPYTFTESRLKSGEFLSWYTNVRDEFLSKQKQDSGSNDNPIASVSMMNIPACDVPRQQSLSCNEHMQSNNELTGTACHSRKKMRKQAKNDSDPSTDQSLFNVDATQFTEQERIAMFERYGFVRDDHKPLKINEPILPEEPKTKVRYLDGKVVDTTGKKYIEFKPEYPNLPQPTFLKALKRYKFH